MKKNADCLERGDVIEWQGRFAVVTEPSDYVCSLPLSQSIKWRHRDVPAKRCCEPRIFFLGKTGRMTSQGTYIIVPNAAQFEVQGFLDLQIRSAVMEPVG